MPTLQKLVIYLLILAVPVSAWPDVMSVCRAQQTMELRVNMTAGHEHASMIQAKSHEMMLHSETGAVSEMECCDDCVAICAAFVGSLATNATSYSDQYFDSHLRLNPSLMEFHTGPPPQSLFRPPIFPA